MSRINVPYYDNGQLRTGWFDDASAECFGEDTYWDGHNKRGRCSGLQIGFEALYHTAGGRWVLHRDAENEFNGGDTWEFIDDGAARDWLMRSGAGDGVIEAQFGPLDEEDGPQPASKGPGRPEVGGRVNVRVGDALAGVDAYAEAQGVSRAEAVRRLLVAGLATAAQ